MRDRLRIKRSLGIGAFVLGAALLFAVPLSVRGQASLGESRRQATRAELEQIAKAAELAASNAPDAKSRARLTADAASIRQRLANGDFLPGDRIYVEVIGDSSLTDTFTVRGDRMVTFPNLPEISLQGVLDSELRTHLHREVSKYVKNPQVSATPLLRLAVMGAIARAGFMTVPIDQALSDVIMAAGGPGQQSSFDKTSIKRAGKTIYAKKEFQEAIRRNRTVGDMSLRDGDEIFVPDKQNTQSYLQYVQIVSAVLGLYLILKWGKGGQGTSRPTG